MHAQPPSVLERKIEVTASQTEAYLGVTAEIPSSSRNIQEIIKRGMDVILASLLLFLCFLPMLMIALAIKLTSKGVVLYWSDRIGKDNHVFQMPKFRSMRSDTPQLASHLLAHPHRYLSPIGAFLRRSSLDELPQLYSILRGDLSFVGPRPALYNQEDLIALRTEKGVHRLLPGLTGWAQVNGRDELPICTKVEYDFEYLFERSFSFDMKILLLTLAKVIRQDGIKH
ncbi:MAG: undecaprenyl-phosphate glycosylphosphotransferase [Acidobacteriaceae bacterium]|nr:undecaprenyl-phosphate glycosylphosphotransferase [Acidobacteriaceae bacterium]